MKKLAVVALGGNALIKEGQKGTIDDQEANVFETCSYLLNLIRLDYDIVLTHGNGPQVGTIMLCYSNGARMNNLPEMPLDIYVAFSQGFIGYMIEQQLRNVLQKNGMDRDIITLITQVIIEKNDPAFSNPSKPVGSFYTKEHADQIVCQTKAVFREDPKGRGWRKVVPSPNPIRINNTKSIEQLARNGQIVITVGGGGIPAFYIEHDKLQGIDAVVDKDLASSLLATQIHADEFIILTDVPKIYLNFNTPDQKALDEITVDEATKYLAEGHFSSGSMAPKVKAAIQFIENGGKSAIITEARLLGTEGAGTMIVENRR